MARDSIRGALAVPGALRQPVRVARAVRRSSEDGVEPRRELAEAACALAAGADEPGALWIRALTGSADAVALGAWQRGSAALRRVTGGRATRYGAGIVSLCAFAPTPTAWLDASGPLDGARLLNRHVRGLLRGLSRLGVRASYPGRDFVAADGASVARLGLTRGPHERLLFQAVIGLDTPCDAEPAPARRGLPDPPPARALAEIRPGGLAFGELSDALAAGFADAFDLSFARGEPVTAAAESPTAESLPGDLHWGAEVAVPIGVLTAGLRLDADGAIACARLRGDWMVAADDLRMLEDSLVGTRPQDPRVTELCQRWLTLPTVLAVGAPDPAALAEAVRSAGG